MVRAMTRAAYLVDGLRSPFGRYGGGLAQVRAALATGAADADAVVEQVYSDVDRSLWPYAKSSVLAQLAYLRDSE